MNLIQAKRAVEEKDKKRSKFLGQKEMLLKNLKKCGFNSLDEAEERIKELKVTIAKMNAHYEKGESVFKRDFGYLLK